MKTQHVKKIASFDGYVLEGKLTLPAGNDEIPKLVVFVTGTGPSTYENRDIYQDVEVCMFEPITDELARRGIAFFVHNQRGIHLSDNAPLFYEMDEDEYHTYLPSNSVEDIYYAISELKTNSRLKNSKVYLLGMSEGTVIAPLFAEKYPDMVDALFLWGYVNNDLRDTLIWQLSGGSFVSLFNEYFETDEAGRISKEAFECGQKEMLTAMGLGDDAFEVCDLNHDGFIDKEEMIALGKKLIGFDSDTLLTAIDSNDDNWLMAGENLGGMKLTSGWFKQHFDLGSNMDRLEKLNLPIFIFHGTLDMNCDVQGVYDVYKRFQKLGKNNLKTYVFKGYDHGLGIAQYLVTNEMPESIKTIYDTIDGIPIG
jgi:pimeloyl-ACP methyl ester carboxylesterase